MQFLHSPVSAPPGTVQHILREGGGMTKAEPDLFLHQGQLLWMLSQEFSCLIAIHVPYREGKGL